MKFERIAGSAINFLRTGLLKTVGNRLDGRYLASDVPMATIASHSNHLEFLAKTFNRKGVRILEIGSRAVTGEPMARRAFSEADYVGLDYYAGQNVDVVGDAHQLAKLVDGKFDLIYSTAVFEHLAMPWVVTPQIASLLKIGGMVFVESHFTFSAHERPWHFFQFSDMAMRVLFPPALGFECVDAGVSNPIVGRFSRFADRYLRYKKVPALYCHCGYLGRKVSEPIEDFTWSGLNLPEIVAGTHYPPMKR